ncbi:MAG: hypothetical protein P1P64_07505 [Treponemataceae bacterium]
MEIDKDFLIETRRNAYVECSMNFIEHNNIVGYYGTGIPLELFYGFELIPVPLEGVDSDVFAFTNETLLEENFCDCIQSTLTYLETEKCPILFSCKAYFFQNFCELMFREFSTRTKKPCIKLELEKDDGLDILKKEIEKISAKKFNLEKSEQAKKRLKYIDSVIEKIENYSDVDGEKIFLLRYYSPYIIDLNTRLEYFKTLEKKLIFKNTKQKRKLFTVACPRGIFKNIYKQVPKSAKIIWDKNFPKNTKLDFADKRCVYEHLHNTEY